MGASANQEFMAKKDPTAVATQPAAAAAHPASAPAQKPAAKVAPRGTRARYQPTIMDQVKYYGNPLNWQSIFNGYVFQVRMFLNKYVTQILLYGGVALGLYLTVGRLVIWQIKNAMSK